MSAAKTTMSPSGIARETSGGRPGGPHDHDDRGRAGARDSELAMDARATGRDKPHLHEEEREPRRHHESVQMLQRGKIGRAERALHVIRAREARKNDEGRDNRGPGIESAFAALADDDVIECGGHGGPPLWTTPYSASFPTSSFFQRLLRRGRRPRGCRFPITAERSLDGTDLEQRAFRAADGD